MGKVDRGFAKTNIPALRHTPLQAREIESMRLSIELPPEIRNDSNDMSKTDIHRTLTTIIDHHLSTHASILDTACNLSQAVLQKVDGAYGVTTHMLLPKRQGPAGLETMEIGIEAISPTAYNREEDVFFITVESQSKLHIRLEGQKECHLHQVEFELSWITPRAYAPPDQRASAIISGGSDAESRDPVPTFSIHCQLANLIEASTHVSYDSLAAAAARVAFQSCEAIIIAPQRVCGIFIKLSEVRSTDKPEAYPLATKFYYFDAQKFAELQRARRDNAPIFGRSRAFIALGSNVGDRTKTMEDALLEMGRRDLKVLRTSSLYETEPMYKTDQPPFMNGVCELETALSPMELLDQLKDIEKLLGRVRTIENGPRTIDLDILLYGNEVIDEPRLQIPHPRISEREFVLRPLC
ncbi:MAG: hypothetical protein Q9194_007222, partial [Teloschistes cf. exilis]